MFNGRRGPDSMMLRCSGRASCRVDLSKRVHSFVRLIATTRPASVDEQGYPRNKKAKDKRLIKKAGCPKSAKAREAYATGRPFRG
jgi:hypothetical protein